MIRQIDEIEEHETQSKQSASPKKPPQTPSKKLLQYAEQKPIQTALIGLGVGVGTGIVLGSILRGSAKYLTQDEVMIERIRNNVRSSLAEMIPSNVAKHFRS